MLIEEIIHERIFLQRLLSINKLELRYRLNRIGDFNTGYCIGWRDNKGDG